MAFTGSETSKALANTVPKDSCDRLVQVDASSLTPETIDSAIASSSVASSELPPSSCMIQHQVTFG